MLDAIPRGRGFEPHRRHCVVFLEQGTLILAYKIVLVQPRNTRPCLTERVLMERKESNQSNKTTTTTTTTTTTAAAAAATVSRTYTTLTSFSTIYRMMCKIYTDVGGIK